MDSALEWPWSRSLALAPVGRAVQVKTILFGTVKDFCSEHGIQPGTVLVCREHGEEWVDVDLPSGMETRLPRHYAWFVSVDRSSSH